MALLWKQAGAGMLAVGEGGKAEGQTMSSLERGHALHTLAYGGYTDSQWPELSAWD